MHLRDRLLSEVDSPAAWRRLGFAVAVSTIGGVGMWSWSFSNSGRGVKLSVCTGRPRAMGNRYRIVPHKVAKKPHSIRASKPRRANSRRRRHDIVAAHCRLRHTNRRPHRLLINRHASLRRGNFQIDRPVPTKVAALIY
jgi:hypothetical protein